MNRRSPERRLSIRRAADPCLLEEILVERLARRPRGGLDHPVLVLVPTRRLAAHLAQRIAAAVPAALNLYLLTHGALARRALEHALLPPPRLLSPFALDALVDGLLADLPGAEAASLREFTGSRRSVLETLNDLREGAVPPEALAAASCGADLLPRLYRRYHEALESLGAQGLADRAGAVRAALPHLGAFLEAKGIRETFHHGAYELIGVNRLLLDEVARTVPTEILLPAAPGLPGLRGPADRFLESLQADAGRVAPARPGSSPSGGGGDSRGWNERLARLQEAEGDRPPEPPGDGLPALEIQHAQGPVAELEAAALRALALHQDGVPLREIALLARSLEPYLPHLEAVLDGLGLPFTTSAARPLARDPEAAAFLTLLRVLAADLERRAVIQLLRQPGLRAGGPSERAGADNALRPARGSLREIRPREVDLWDRWSRKARVVSGLEAWKDIPERALRRHEAESDGDSGLHLDGNTARRLTAEPDARPEGGPRPEPNAEPGPRSDGEPAPSVRADPGPEPGAVPGPADVRASCAPLFDLLERLDGERRRWAACTSLEEHADFLAGLAARWLAASDPGPEAGPPAPPPPVRRLLRALRLAARAARSALPRASEEPPATVPRVHDLLQRAALEEGLPLRDADTGGVRVLDLMQARGLTHRVAIWLGFHDGLFPRRPREDPFLPDRLRERLSRPAGPGSLALKGPRAREERLLLTLTAGSARERLVVSFQRADAGGAAIARSSALRDLAWLFTGRAAASALLGDEEATPEARHRPVRPERVPAHPEERLLLFARSPRFGLLPAGRAAAAAALGVPGGTGAARAVLEALGTAGDRGPQLAREGGESRGVRGELGTAGEWEPRLAWVDRIEAFAPDDGAADAMTGLGLGEEFLFTPTALERLARCPLQFFLRHVLRVRELEEDAAPHLLAKDVLGTAVHETLARLYRELARGGSLGETSASAADALLGPLWSEELERAAGSSYRRLPGLYALAGERWLEALRDFVRRDLGEIAARGAEPLGFEETLAATLEGEAGGRRLRWLLKGRLDRVLRAGGEILVDDYKTSGDLAKRRGPAEMLKGQELQLFLYRELAAAARGVEWTSVGARVLGVGPWYEENEKAAAAVLDGDAANRAGVLETAAVVVALARAGRFPLRPDPNRCRYCAYRRTCRRSHAPTQARLENDRTLADFRRLAEKSSKGKQTLARLGGDEEPPARGPAPGEERPCT